MKDIAVVAEVRYESSLINIDLGLFKEIKLLNDRITNLLFEKLGKTSCGMFY